MLNKIISFALLLGSLLAVDAIVAVPAAEEKGAVVAEGAEGWINYAPARIDSYLVDSYQLAGNGFIVGANPGQWSLVAGGPPSTIVGNILNTITGTPIMLVSNTAYELPGYGDWQLMTGMSFASFLQSGSVTSPLGFNQDPFYGQGYFGAGDWVNGWNFGFALTNTRIYAIYNRYPTAQNLFNNYFSFAYAVPIAQRNAIDIDTLSLVINKKDNKVSYRANGFELLVLDRPGEAIAEKFKIGDFGGATAEVSLPSSVNIFLGLMEPIENAYPHTACQQTLFQACGETIDCAYKTLCQYAPIQDHSTYSLNLTASYAFITVIEQSPVLTCYHDSKCPQFDSSCSCPSSVSSCSSSWPSSSSSSCSWSSSSSCSSSSSSSSCGCCESSSSSPSCSCSSSSSSECCQPCCSSSSSSASCPSTLPCVDGPQVLHSSSHCCRPESSSSSSSDSEACPVETPEECLQRRQNLRRQGFIFPF